MPHFILVLILFLSTSIQASADDAIAMGKQLAFSQNKGNCLACHQIADGLMPGNIGPPLVRMKQRFQTKQQLQQQIWDASIKNPNTIMPPFGRNHLLTEQEIQMIVEFLWSL